MKHILNVNYSFQLGQDFDAAEAIAKTCKSDDMSSISRFENLWSKMTSDYQGLRSLGDLFIKKCHQSIDDTNLNLTGAQR